MRRQRLFLLTLLALLSAITFGYVATASGADEGYGIVIEIVPSVCGCATVQVFVDGHPEATLSSVSGGAAVLPMGTDLSFDVSWACVGRDALKREPVLGPRRANNIRGTRCVVEAAQL